MMNPAVAQSTAILDDRPLSGFQIRTLLLCALIAVLDGNDTQLLSLGAPSIAAALKVPPSAMGWAISGSWLGAAAGALLFGRLADRFGRKSALVFAVTCFGIFTLATPFATSLETLTIYRVLTGIGLGGATPCFIALAAEYAPARMRGTVVSLVWAAFPLGLLIGGLSGGWLLAHYSWDAIFYVGGALSLAIAALLVPLLPESLSFLLSHEHGRERAARILAILAPGVVPVAQPARRASEPASGGVAQLVGAGRLRATLCLWIMLFACFGTTASMSWLPTILRQHGVTPPAAAVAVSFLGLGALLGMAVAGRVVDRFGAARGLVAPMLLGAVATAAMGIWPGSTLAASVCVALVGALVGIGASGAIALMALVYPTGIRSTGAGWGMGLGRLGQVVLPAIFATLMAQQWETGTIFVMLGVMPLVAAAAACFVQRPAPVGWLAAPGLEIDRHESA